MSGSLPTEKMTDQDSGGTFISTIPFRCYLSRRWNELIQPGQPLNLTTLNDYIDQTVAYISEAVAQGLCQMGNNRKSQPEDRRLKSWLAVRIPWITTNLGSYSDCSSVAVPPLVISKIMFNPPVTVWFPDGEELEFIEITNAGDTEVNLSGIYFAGTGLVYQFPYDATIAPDTSIYLAANSSLFYSKYGFEPFGEFTRHLSNEGQNVILSDAFGNVVDNVHFSDTIPWPEADGNGFYLKLKDPGLDNNIPGSWIACNDLILSGEDVSYDDGLVTYPNPVRDVLRIKSERIIVSLELYDMTGRQITSVFSGNNTYDLNMEQMPAGVYILKAVTPGKTFTKRILHY